jgi:hypothetical protein
MRRYYLHPRYPGLMLKCRFHMGRCHRRGFRYRRRKQAGLASYNPNPDPAEGGHLLPTLLGPPTKVGKNVSLPLKRD